jgi:hypothetical protein
MTPLSLKITNKSIEKNNNIPIPSIQSYEILLCNSAVECVLVHSTYILEISYGLEFYLMTTIEPICFCISKIFLKKNNFF